MSTRTSHFNGEFPKLINATIEELSAGMNAKNFTSLQLVRAYKRRIAEVNHDFNVVLEVNPDAESIARELDKERVEKGARGYEVQTPKHTRHPSTDL